MTDNKKKKKTERMEVSFVNSMKFVPLPSNSDTVTSVSLVLVEDMMVLPKWLDFHWVLIKKELFHLQ